MITFKRKLARRELKTPAWFFIIGLLTAYVGPISLAAETPSIREVCVEFHEARDKFRMPSKWRLVWDVIRLKYFPGSLVRVQHTPIEISSDKKVREHDFTADPEQTSAAGENIIFSIDPPERFIDSEKIGALRLRNAELNRLLKTLMPQLMPIVSAQTVERCVNLAQRSNFDFENFKKISEEKQSLRILDQIDEAKVANATLANTVGRLHLKWKVIHTTDLHAVHESLRSSQTRNIVILSHGLSTGKLIDSSLNEYPLGFFSEISPSIRSVSIFSCHAPEIAKSYKLREKLAQAKSQYGMRHLYIADGVQLAALPGMEDIVPVRSFRSFMRKVDASLSWRPRDLESGPEAEVTPLCKIKMEGLKVTQGTLGFSLNGRFIGAVDETFTAIPALTYPCTFEDRVKNILIIHSLNLIISSGVQSLDFQPTLEHPGFSIGKESLKNYHRSDGSYQGSKYEFEWKPNTSFFLSTI